MRKVKKFGTWLAERRVSFLGILFLFVVAVAASILLGPSGKSIASEEPFGRSIFGLLTVGSLFSGTGAVIVNVLAGELHRRLVAEFKSRSKSASLNSTDPHLRVAVGTAIRGVLEDVASNQQGIDLSHETREWLERVVHNERLDWEQLIVNLDLSWRDPSTWDDPQDRSILAQILRPEHPNLSKETWHKLLQFLGPGFPKEGSQDAEVLICRLSDWFGKAFWEVIKRSFENEGEQAGPLQLSLYFQLLKHADVHLSDRQRMREYLVEVHANLRAAIEGFKTGRGPSHAPGMSEEELSWAREIHEKDLPELSSLIETRFAALEGAAQERHKATVRLSKVQIALGLAILLLVTASAYMVLNQNRLIDQIPEVVAREISTKIGPLAASVVERLDKPAEPLTEHVPDEQALRLWNAAVLDESAGDLTKATEGYSAAIRLDPKFFHAYFNRGRLHSLEANHKLAADDYTRAIDLHQYSAAYAGRASARLQLNQTEDALKDLDEAIKLDSKNSVAFNLRGIVYDLRGDLEKAIDDWTQSIRLDTGFAGNYFNRGLAYDMRKEYGKAALDFERAFQLDPHGGAGLNSLNNLGAIKKDIHFQREESIKDFTVVIERAGKLGPSADMNLIHSAYLNRGSAWQGLGKFRKAMVDLDYALILDKDSVRARLNRARAKFGLGKFPDAHQDLDHVIVLEPNNGEAHYLKGLAYSLTDKTKAQKYLNRAKSLGWEGT